MQNKRRDERRGRWAEQLAALLLLAKGYRILARRHRTPVGEIDIVARRGRTLAFVEVKLRAEIDDAALATGPRQRRRITRAAQRFAQQTAHARGQPRFDVVLVAPWRFPRHLTSCWRDE